MRKNIFEILKEADFIIEDEIKKLDKIFISNLWTNDVTLETCAQKGLQEWKHRGTIVSVSEIRKKLNLPDFRKPSPIKPLKQYDLFNYIEFMANMIYLARSFFAKGTTSRYITDEGDKKIYMIEQNIHTIAQKFGYELRFNDEMTYLVELSAEATAVAENYEEIANEVIEYKRYSTNGNLKQKRTILQTLANKYEEISHSLKTNDCSGLCGDIGTMLNNLKIRHGNAKNNELVNKMSDEELENWYDNCYDCLILAFLFKKYLLIKKDIKNLRATLSEK